MDEPPLVTIGMSFRNARSTLAMAIRSILAQTCRDFELLLADDGSSDGSQRIAADFAASDARILLQADGQSLGLPSRLNQLIARSRGRYFARMDADDLCFPARIATQLALMRAQPELSMVGGRALVFRDDGILLGRLPFQEHHDQIVNRPGRWIPLVHPTWFGRREWFAQLLYDPSFTKAQDQELLLRSLGQSRFQCTPEIVLAYRQDRLSLRKILASRYHHARALFQHFRRTHQPAIIVGSTGQAAKMLVDTVAVGSGLHYRLLAHRSLPLLNGDQDRFTALWASVQDPACAA